MQNITEQYFSLSNDTTFHRLVLYYSIIILYLLIYLTIKLRDHLSGLCIHILLSFILTDVSLFFPRFIDLLVTIPIKNIRIVHPERAECFLFMVEVCRYTTIESKLLTLLQRLYHNTACS